MIESRTLLLITIGFLWLWSPAALILEAQDADEESGAAWTLTRKGLEEKAFRCVDAGAWMAAGNKYVVLSVTGSSMDQRASVRILEIAEDYSSLKLVRNLELVNPVRPSYNYLTPDGRFFLTFDEEGTCGNSPRDMVIYDLALSTVKIRRIDDFLPDDVLTQLEGPVYMGGDGLREWVDLRSPRYVEDSMMLYPTSADYSNLENESSTIPYLAIDLLTGEVKVVSKNEYKGVDRSKEEMNSRRGGADWGTKDGTQNLSDDAEATYFGLIIPRHKEGHSNQIKAGYELNSKTGNYKRIDWEKFLSKSKSKLGKTKDQ